MTWRAISASAPSQNAKTVGFKVRVDDLAGDVYQALPEVRPDVRDMRRRWREPHVPRVHEGAVLRRALPNGALVRPGRYPGIPTSSDAV